MKSSRPSKCGAAVCIIVPCYLITQLGVEQTLTQFIAVISFDSHTISSVVRVLILMFACFNIYINVNFFF